MIRHRQHMASVATTIAAGDLRPDVEAASANDVLGHAFTGMLRNLHASWYLFAKPLASAELAEMLSVKVTRSAA